MPTTYAHDLFGKRVYRKLPKEMREIIRRNGDLYRIGLHGPDILFYYMVSKNPVSRFGVQMHKEKARAFFEEGMRQVRETGDEQLLSYLLGFGCHYLLDSSCHSFVDEMAEAGVISHTILEKEFDRMLMEKTGKNPYVYRPSDCIVPACSYARVIHRAIPLVCTVNICISLHMMKFLTNLMVCNDGGKRRRVIEKLLCLGGTKNAQVLIEHFMTKEPIPGCEIPLAKLEKLFDDAVEEAPEHLAKLYVLSHEEGTLGSRWERTYNG